jgi:hypothetical protein
VVEKVVEKEVTKIVEVEVTKATAEVGSLQGSVAGGEPHIHVVVDDVANDKVYVGHLEPGSRCCFRLELGVIVLEGVRTRRVQDPETKLVDIIAVED